MRESELVNQIIRAVYDEGNKIFRINTGTVIMSNGRRFSTGTPKGFSDLMGVRGADGVAFFIECKVKPNKPTPEQIKFIESVKQVGALAGVAYSVDDALAIVHGEAV